MGFVVEEFPFGSGIVLNGAVLIVGHGEGFGAGPQKKIFGAVQPDSYGSGPDDFSDIPGFGDVDLGFQGGAGGFAGGDGGRLPVKAFADRIVGDEN